MKWLWISLVVVGFATWVAITIINKARIKAKKTKLKVGQIICPFVALVFLCVIVSQCHEIKQVEKDAKVEVAQALATKATERWSFLWRKAPGKTDRDGENSHKLKVLITLNDNTNSFEAILHEENKRGIEENVAVLTLKWINGDLIGIWSNTNDGDGGKAYLYKTTPDHWSGNWDHKDKTITHIELNKTTTTEVSKPRT